MSGWQVIRVDLATEGSNPAAQAWRPERTLLIFPSTPEGDALAGIIAARLDAAMLGRVSEIAFDGDTLVARRPAYGGRILLELRLTHGVAIATMNEAAACDDSVSLSGPRQHDIERVQMPTRNAALEGARTVVSGGRRLDAESFAVLDSIAQRLDGALGASLPAVDLGFAPVSRQVGQSGHFATPRIYLAVGISGTPQHLAGISAATQIIAINSDADAPIFRYAEVGVVADAKEFLPELLRSIGA
mgnify:CR=1 FL=1